MSTESQLTAFALQDILLGIASSLNDAQQAMNERPPYDAFGRPNTLYHVPHLDFNLQVTSEFESVSETGSGSDGGDGALEAVPDSQFMKFSPANVASAQDPSQSKTEIYSTISGRFVATVPNEGLPQTVIQIKPGTPETSDPSKVDIALEVIVSNAAGEILPDSLVEYNFDEATTDSLNPSNPEEKEPPIVTTFSISELRTNREGKATTIVTLNPTEYGKGKFAVIEVNVGTTVKSIALSNQ